MKKITAGLIGILLVLMLNSNAWAQSGLRIDLGGFGLSISDGHSGVTAYSYTPYRPYPNNYSGYYPNRPYLGWGGYRGHHHHNNHKDWGHHRSSHHRKNHYYSHQRSHQRGHNNQNHGNRQRQNHNGHQRHR
jgi:hypothetical protein